jgi:hypothetical protein
VLSVPVHLAGWPSSICRASGAAAILRNALTLAARRSRFEVWSWNS